MSLVSLRWSPRCSRSASTLKWPTWHSGSPWRTRLCHISRSRSMSRSRPNTTASQRRGGCAADADHHDGRLGQVVNRPVLLELRHACLLRFDGHADAEDAVPRDGFGGQLSDAPRTFSAPQAFLRACERAGEAAGVWAWVWVCGYSTRICSLQGLKRTTASVPSAGTPGPDASTTGGCGVTHEIECDDRSRRCGDGCQAALRSSSSWQCHRWA
jgi:hypothetical protein